MANVLQRLDALEQRRGAPQGFHLSPETSARLDRLSRIGVPGWVPMEALRAAYAEPFDMDAVLHTARRGNG